MSLRRVEVNGVPGAVNLDAQQRLIAVVAIDIAGDQITEEEAVGLVLPPDGIESRP